MDHSHLDPGAGTGSGPHRAPLTRREREILGLLAEGMSGSQIAAKLVLSPETVRTHVRNAMAKLGASTRSQAVALALQRQEIAGDSPARSTTPSQASSPPGSPRQAPADVTVALATMIAGLVSLYDVEAGAVFLSDEDGLSLRRVADAGGDALGERTLPPSVALGEGALGRAALDRRAQLLQDPASGALIAAPLLGGGRLHGVIALAARPSRPVGRSELLLLQAFANHVGEVLLTGGDADRRLERAMERFRTSWTAAGRVA